MHTIYITDVEPVPREEWAQDNVAEFLGVDFIATRATQILHVVTLGIPDGFQHALFDFLHPEAIWQVDFELSSHITSTVNGEPVIEIWIVPIELSYVLPEG